MSPAANIHIAIYAVLLLFFAFFYTSITFNPDDVADNMKRYGGFMPGIRAGRPTAEYLQYVINSITSAVGLYLAIIAIYTNIVFAAHHLPAPQRLALGGP